MVRVFQKLKKTVLLKIEPSIQKFRFKIWMSKLFILLGTAHKCVLPLYEFYLK